MTVEEIDDMNLQPLETPVLKVSRPVAVSILDEPIQAIPLILGSTGLQPLQECQDQVRWQVTGLFVLRKEWPSGRVYEYE